ncbi:MAG: RraA family protein [Phycisphaeraceae bacterium]
MPPRLSHADLLQLKRWNTPTIYNGWEQITSHDRTREGINLQETRDFMPHMGPMVGYAVTVVIEPSNAEHPKRNLNAWDEYRQYIFEAEAKLGLPEGSPKIVVMQDLDKPAVIGSAWGEVNANIHRAGGCVGVIVDGAIRDLDEMNAAGFKAIARRLCVGHAHACPVRWDCDVEVFGQRVQPGQLIHADKHGFLAIPREDEAKLLHAATFMDANECNTLIAAARETTGQSKTKMLEQLNDAARRFGEAAAKEFQRGGEWG